MTLRDQLNQMDNRTLYLNVVWTQLLLFLVGVVLYLIFLRKEMGLRELFHMEQWGSHILLGLLFAIGVLLLDFILMKWLPKDYFDDGGVNERLFRDINPLQIALIALTVALIEEWLFRGVIQNMIGIFWTSLLFAVIHYRYFRKWVYGILIISISFGFGYLYEWTGSMWSVITAHFAIDFCLGLAIRYQWLKKEDI